MGSKMKWTNGATPETKRRLATIALTLFLLIGSTALAASAVAAEASAGESAPESIRELLLGFKKTTGLEARFEEEKYLALLATPLHSSGRLFFLPPSTLLRRVEKPRQRDILVTANRVRISDESGVQTIDLDAREEIRPLVKSMIWIFTGDLESLEEIYRIEYRVLKAEDEGGDEKGSRWRIRLEPRKAPLSHLVTEIRVGGKAGVADVLELVETTGDRTLTRIFDVNSRRQFDAAARRELFASP